MRCQLLPRRTGLYPGKDWQAIPSGTEIKNLGAMDLITATDMREKPDVLA